MNASGPTRSTRDNERGTGELPGAIVTAFIGIVAAVIILGAWNLMVRVEETQEPRLVTAAQARNQLVRARAATACDANALTAVTSAGNTAWNPSAAEHVAAQASGNNIVLEDAAHGVASRMSMRLLQECLPGGTTDYTR